MEIIKVILTSVLSAAALFVIAKFMGHKQISQLDFFDYICGITIGSIAAELATELETPWKPLIALVSYGVISVILNFLTRKFPRARRLVNGTPTILFNEGKLYRKNMKKSKLDLSEFLLLCREQGYFDLDEIQTAVFEPNGRLSVLPKSAYRPVTPKDLEITVKSAHIGTEVIMDGRILEENLYRMGRDEKWLRKQLKAQGNKKAKDIFLGMYHADDDTVSLYPMD